MRGWMYAMTLAASLHLVACDRVFGLSDTKLIPSDDAPDPDAMGGDDAADGGGGVCDASCVSTIAPGEMHAGEIDYYIDNFNVTHLVWTINFFNGSIHTCALPTCQVLPLVSDVENLPVALTHDGDTAFWITGDSNGVLKKASLAGIQQVGTSACPDIPKMRNYAIIDGFYAVTFESKLVYSVWSAVSKACTGVPANLSTDPVTGAMAVGTNGNPLSSKFAYVGFDDHVGAYNTTTNHALPIETALSLTTTPKFILAPAQNAVLMCPLGGTCTQPLSLAMSGSVISMTTDPAGNAYAAVTDPSSGLVDIVRVATPNAFGPVVTLATGLPLLADFIADGTDFYGIVGDDIVKIALH